jgi:Na+-translocating ferredoxin:NAD+ oxidoreductase RnfE subunit
MNKLSIFYLSLTIVDFLLAFYFVSQELYTSAGIFIMLTVISLGMSKKFED